MREGSRLLHGAVPLGQQRLQILVGVDVLHKVTQRLKGRGVLDLVIGGVKAAVLVVKPGVCFLILPQDVLEVVRAVIISGLNQLVCAAEHLVPTFSLLPKVHLTSLFTELGDGQIVQLCTGVLSHQPLHKPFNEDLVNDSKGIAVDQILWLVIGESRLSIQTRCNMSGKLIVPAAIQDVVHQIVHEGDDVSGLVGGKCLPRLRQLGRHILCRIGDKHGHNQLFKRGLHIRIAKMLLT